MHRSGTSLFARLVCNAGGDLGDPGTFYRPDRWNPDGYYEQREIQHINRKLIHGAWGRLAYFALPSELTILKRTRKHVFELKALSEIYDHKFVKDARFCLTFPAWIFAGTTFDRVVLCIREPAEVATSLQKRNHISRALALRLWCQHYDRLLPHLEKASFHVLHYNRLVSANDWERELRAALEYLELTPGEEGLRSLRPLIRIAPAPGGKREDYPAQVSALWGRLSELYGETRSRNRA